MSFLIENILNRVYQIEADLHRSQMEHFSTIKRRLDREKPLIYNLSEVVLNEQINHLQQELSKHVELDNLVQQKEQI